MPMFVTIGKLKIHDCIKAINNPASFRPYSALGNVNISEKEIKNISCYYP